MKKTSVSFLSKLFLTAAFLAATQGFADTRSDKRIGVTFGVLSDPFPSLWSVEGHFNVTSFLQVHAGYGQLNSTSGTTTISTSAMGGGVKAFLPGWSLSPFAGFSFARWKGNGTVTFMGKSFGGSNSLNVMTLSGGLDWQTGWGFNIGGGLSYVLSPDEISSVLSIVPQVYFGWYF